MKRALVLLSLFGVACGAAQTSAPAHAPSARFVDLAWLAEGPWQTEADEQGCFTIETWRRVDDTHLAGQSIAMCSSDDSTARALEDLVLEERPDGIFYVASPVDQARTEFALTEADASHFVVENPTHDFPTRIAYTRVGDTALSAVVSGPERSFTLEMTRTPRE